jgi:ubiquinone/menaquinone biosynthesis C-methylase UbiE
MTPPLMLSLGTTMPITQIVLPQQSSSFLICAQLHQVPARRPFQVPAVLRYELENRRNDMKKESQVTKHMNAGSNEAPPPPAGGAGETPPPGGNKGGSSGGSGNGDGNSGKKGGKSVHNFYDDPTFFESYNGMRNATHSANDHIEKPYLRKIMPDMTGKRVLDLGCGAGSNILNFMTSAASIDAVDISEKMLALLKKAAKERGLKNINIIRSSIEDFEFKADNYDVVVSTLAFHYVENLGPVFAAIAKSLIKGGVFIFNVEHPVYTATRNQGWETKPSGEYAHWRLDNYFEQGSRRVVWHGIEVERYHRTVEDYFSLLVDNGFQVARVLEPQPDQQARQLDPELNRHHRRPPFLMFLAYKR